LFFQYFHPDASQCGGTGVECFYVEEAFVRLYQQVVGRAETEGFGVEVLAKGEKKPFAEELAGLFGFATEGVDNPRFVREALFVQTDYLVEGFDAMHDEGFADLFGQTGLHFEGFHLKGNVASSHTVDTCFTYSRHLR
jgi:hypothetical protein